MSMSYKVSVSGPPAIQLCKPYSEHVKTFYSAAWKSWLYGYMLKPAMFTWGLPDSNYSTNCKIIYISS